MRSNIAVGVPLPPLLFIFCYAAHTARASRCDPHSPPPATGACECPPHPRSGVSVFIGLAPSSGLCLLTVVCAGLLEYIVIWRTYITRSTRTRVAPLILCYLAISRLTGLLCYIYPLAPRIASVDNCLGSSDSTPHILSLHIACRETYAARFCATARLKLIDVISACTGDHFRFRVWSFTHTRIRA